MANSESSSNEPQWDAPSAVSYPWWLEILIGILFLTSAILELAFRDQPALGEVGFHLSGALLFFSVGLERRLRDTGRETLRRALWWGKVIFGAVAAILFAVFLTPGILEAIWA